LDNPTLKEKLSDLSGLIASPAHAHNSFIELGSHQRLRLLPVTKNDVILN
jgi:hypothetical protein